MSTLKLFPALILILFLNLSQPASGQVKIPFSFSLPNTSSTSAGVFTSNGVLVKTIWSGVKYNAGNQTGVWDGTGDDGKLVPNANYNIRVLSNNVNYTWDGVIGNTSSAATGPTIHRGYLRMYSMAIAGNTAYYSNYYNEGHSSQYKFDLNNPQSRKEILSYGQSSMFVATDGTNVYWAGDDVFGGHSRWFVFGTKTSDDTEVSFSAGQSLGIQYGRTYGSVIDLVDNINANITGLVVQKTGNYLFISRQNINEVRVLNKTTGALVRTLSITSPQRLAVDGNDNLWIVSAGGINKYSINADGTLGNSLASINNVSEAWAISVAPDNNTVVVADGGNSQQLKAFNNSNGNAVWTFGQAGGYANDPTVTDNKFYFTDQIHNNDGTFIAFQPDGSFWVEDPGNYRAEHYASDRRFIDRIMYLPGFYGASADPNNPTKVFADYLEFNVNHSLPIAPDNGSWTLVKNWRHNLPPTYGYLEGLRATTTLSNGRTYAFIRHLFKYAVAELAPTGIRFTGYETENMNNQLQADGTILEWGGGPVGQPFGAGSHPLTGFDGSNNPSWGLGFSDRAQTEPMIASDPNALGSGNVVKTSSGRYVTFDAGLPPQSSTNYHLGGFKSGGSEWLWKTAKSTFKEYNGPFPNDGSYDIGNEVQYAGNMVTVLDNSVIWGYHGEFWKGGEINYHNHVSDDGLLIGQFGASGGSIGLAGNVQILSSVVKDNNGNAYLYENDESVHGGLHEWKISGASSIQEQSTSIAYTQTPGGLLGNYFDGTDLNNLNKKISRIDAVPNVVSLPSQVPNTDNFSVYWSGFVHPAFSENYTFYATSNSKVRVWVNNSLIINQWNNSTTNDFASSPVTLKSGAPSSIRIEYSNTNGAAKNMGLSWASASQSKEIVPSHRLYAGIATDTVGGIDLLEGLPYRGILENNLYGWQRNNAVQDTTGPIYNVWWDVKTNDQSFKNPDIHVNFAQNNKAVEYTVTRDLGTTPDGVSWKLSGHISHEGDALSPSDSYSGSFIAILNTSGEAILEFKAFIDYATLTESLYANGQLIARAPAATFYEVWRNVQPLELAQSGNQISVTYAQYPTIFVNPLHTGSPKTFALLFRSNFSGANRIMDIVDMRYSKSPASALPLDLLIIKAVAGVQKVNLLWSTENEINTKYFIVQRSKDAQAFDSIGSVNAASRSGRNNYNFPDYHPLDGISYYRLKMVDIDGRFKYSPVVSVNRNDKNMSLEVYPNPVRDILKINHQPVTQNGGLRIVSSDGKSLKNIILQNGVTNSSIDIRSLPPGPYMIQFRDGTSTKTTEFIKE